VYPGRATMSPAREVGFKRPRTPHYDDPFAVGRRLYEGRMKAGLSQRELAFPGCSAAYISRIERGERVPSLQVLRELARRVGLTETVLAYGSERLDAAVARCIREAEEAGSTGDRATQERAYRALAKAAGAAARALAPR
jgi:transcriptional regulator with XRE-family HTH domain